MKRRLSAAFVVTISVGALACHKTQDGGSSSCEPPDCHANPPPQPTPTINANPPANFEAGMPTDVPTISRNPPPVTIDAGARRIIGNPPPLRDGGLLP